MATRTRRPTHGRRHYDGQMTEAELLLLVKQRGEEAAARRLKWLQDHPDYIPCSVAGCSGLVGPAYQRKDPQGRTWGFCPRRTSHARLAPSVFGQAKTG